MDVEDFCYLASAALIVGGVWKFDPAASVIVLGVLLGTTPIAVRLFRRPKKNGDES